MGQVLANPVVKRELIANLRTPRSFFFLLIFVSILACLPFFLWPAQGTPMQQAVNQSEEIFYFISLVSLSLMAVLVPALSAGSITSEKELASLDLLLTTPLKPWALVMGKFVSSTIYLLVVIFATLPIVSLCPLMSGFDFSRVICLFLILLISGAFFGTIGLACSAYFDRSAISFAACYLSVLPVAAVELLILAGGGEGAPFISPAGVFGTAVLLGFAGLAFLAVAARRMGQPFNPVPKAASEEKPEEQLGMILDPNAFPDKLLLPSRSGEYLPDNSHPMVEKELRYELVGRGTLMIRMLVQASLILSIPLMLVSFIVTEEWIFADYLAVLGMIIGATLAANSLAQEWERGTFALLGSTPLGPGHILWGKFFAPFRFAMMLLGIVGLIPLMMLCLIGTHPLAIPPFFGIIVLSTILAVSLGLFYASLFQNTMKAMVGTYLTLLLLILTPPTLLVLLGQDSPVVEAFNIISPFHAAATVTAEPVTGELSMLFGWPLFLALCLLVSMLLAGVSYLLLIRRGRRVGWL